MSVTQLNGLVYLTAGDTSQGRSQALYVYDPATKVWTTRAPYPDAARDHVGIAAVGQFVYIMGGILAWPTPSVSSVHRYDPASNTWTAMAPMPLPRGAMAVAALNGKIYAAGGLRDGEAVTDFAVYDPATNTWTTLPPLPVARDHVVGVALNGKFYAIGGRPGHDAICDPITRVDAYDPGTNVWAAVAPMTAARGGHAAGTLNGRIQVFGGEGTVGGSCGAISSAEEYNPSSNTWTALPPMPTPRHGTGGATINNSIYLPGGGTSAGHAPTNVHDRFTLPAALPTPWVSADVGTVGAAGTATHASGTFTIDGAGADIWGTVDAFQFVHQPLNGDGQIVARVASLENTHSNAKSGVMIRESLAANARHAMMNVTPGAGAEFLRRLAPGGASSVTAGGSAPAPYWVRLQRQGNTFTASKSTDGTTWQLVGSDTIAMAASVYIGLAVTSHVQGNLATSTVDNVTVTGSTPPPPPPPAPAAPTSLTATASSSTQVNLAWTDTATNESGFKIERCTGSTCTTFVEIAQTGANATAFSNTGLTANTTYRYRVRAFNSGGDSAYTNIASVATPPTAPTAPAAPTSLTATASSSTQINLAWTDTATTESGFKIERCTGANCTTFVEIAQTAANATTFSNTGLIANTTYRYRVRAFNSGGDSAYTNLATATTPTSEAGTLPAPWVSADVGSVGAAGTATHGSGTFTIDGAGADIWGTADAFQFVYQPLNGDGQIVARVASLENTHSNAKSGVMIRESLAANARHAMMNVTPGAGAEFLRRLAAGGATSLTAGGTAPVPYWVRLQRQGSTFTASKSTDGTTWQLVGSDTIAMAASVYIGLAVTSHVQGNLATSTVDNVTVTGSTPPPPPPTPAAPTSLTATASSSTQVNLAWTDTAANESGFKIERCTGANCTTFVEIAQTAANVTTFNNTGLSANTTYVYRVRAFNTGGDSAYTNTASVATPPTAPAAPAAPTSLTATASSSTQVNLAWTDTSTNESGFKIERCTGSTCTTFVEIAQAGANATTFSNTGLIANTTYRYRVRAFNSGGDSAYTNIATATTPASQPGGLPAPWLTTDVGSVGIAGTAAFSSGTFTIEGAGADIWGSADAFRFVYQQVNNDTQIVARVATLENTHPNAKSGVMIRESLAANARHALINVTPGAGAEFIYRANTGGPSGFNTGDPVTAPHWVKIVRVGGTISGYTSASGVDWKLVGSQTMTMGATVYVGIAVTSRTTQQLSTSTVDNVSVSLPPEGPPQPIAPTSLTDNFNDNQRDTGKWYLGWISSQSYEPDESGEHHFPSDMLVKALEQNGRLEISPRTNVSGSRYNGYFSVNAYDFTAKNVSVEVVQAPNPASWANAALSVVVNSHAFYRFLVEHGMLRFEAQAGGAINATEITFNSAQHKFLRLRHDPPSNTIVWETSADRLSWTVQRSLSAGLNLSSIRFEIGAGTYVKESQPGVAIFDNFRMEPNVSAGVNKPPVADPGGPYTSVVGQSVQFSATQSYDPDGTIQGYEWNFGDGATGTGASPTHTYTSSGTYTALLKVTDNNGVVTKATTKVIQIVPATVGQWSKPVDVPVVGVHAHLLPNGKLLMWQHESTSVAYVWDPIANNGVFDPVPIHSNQNGTRRDSIYCAGHSFLPDGRLFATGGHIEPQPDTVVGSKLTNIFDYTLNRWFSGPDMNDGRWYPSNVTLANGATLVLSGSIDDNFADVGIEGYPYRVNQLPQVYESNGQFRSLTSANLKLPLYPMAHLAPNGKVFVAGPDLVTRYLDTAGAGTWTIVGNSNSGTRAYGASVMYERGKVLIVGGNQSSPTASAEVIDLSAPAPAWRVVAPMTKKRTRVNATTLPDGKVLVTGGHAGADDPTSAVLAAELWDPITETWSTMAEMAVPRLHHSTALLLPDGRVLSTGGGQPTIGPGDYDHYDAEYYSPPYLFKGARPTITAAPSTVGYGQIFNVDTPDAASITQVTWIRLPSVTHQFNQNQGFNRLTFTKTATGLSVTAPANGNLAQPGHYMLFILNGNGVPSIAKIVKIDAAAPPAAPSNLAATTPAAGRIDLTWVDNSNNETGFAVERCQGTGCTSFVEITRTAAGATSYSNTGLTANTTYAYRVRAFNTGGNSAYSNTATGTTSSPAPSAPTGLTATVVSGSQINLAWTDTSTNESGFKIERCTGTNCTTFVEIAQTAANATTFANTGLSANTTYVYRVRAFNTGGDSAYTNTASGTTSSTGPSAPTGLTATASSSTQINLAWTDAATTESGFKIERCTGSTCTTFVEIAQAGANATTFSNTGLTAETSYRYRVRAFNAGGDSAYTNIATATTPAAEPANTLPAPWVSADVGTVGATGTATHASGTFTIDGAGADIWGTVDAFHFVHQPLNGDGQIVARVATLENTHSNAKSGVMVREALAANARHAMMNVTPGAGAEFLRRLAPGGATALTAGGAAPVPYWVRLQRQGDTFTASKSTDGTTWQLVGSDTIAMATSVYIGVAVTSHVQGNLATSTVSNVTVSGATPAPSAPTGLTATVLSGSQINLAWTDTSTNESGFKIERCTGTNCTTFVETAQTAANATTFANTGLSANTTYVYRVRAFNTGGDSAYTNTASGTTSSTAPSAPTGLTATASSSTQINLAWTDAATTESGFKIERCTGSTCTTFVEIAQAGANATTFSNPGLTADTSYRYRVRAFNSGGDSAYTNIATATTPAAEPAGTLPAPWVSADVGTVGATGTATHASGTFTIDGAGADIWGTADGFQFLHQPLNGDGQIVARVATLENTHSNAKSGVMIRETLAANARHAMMNVTPGAGAEFLRRLAPGGATALTAGGAAPVPYWVRLQRQGDTFTASKSTDGTTWQLVGSDTIAMATSVYIGVAVTSHVQGNLATSTVSNVTVTGATSPPPPAPPVAPTGLTATASSSTQINLAWTDASTNESGFKIERCTGTNCTTFVEIAQTAANASTFTNTGLSANTTYVYRVRAFNTGGDSGYTNTASGTTSSTAPSAPTSLTATGVSSSQINLAWTDTATNESGFKIERCTGTNCTTFVEIAQTAANATTFNNTGLSANTTYVYRVRAFNTAGNSAYSNTAQAVTTADPPAAPTSLSATTISSSQIRLAWTDTATSESGFKIERCQGAGCTTFVQISQTAANATSYDDTALAPSTTYRYRVRAYNSGGDSPYSNEAAQTTDAAPPPATPTNLAAAAASTSEVNLTWSDASSDESGFKIERCAGTSCTDFVQIAQVGVNVTTYKDMGVAASTTYAYRVRAFNTNGHSAYSNTAQAATPEPPIDPPPPPTDLAATAVSSTQIDLTWVDASPNETGFRIERCAGASCTAFVQVAQTASNVITFSDTALQAETAYTYRVRAYNAGGDSAYSNTASATTLPPPPVPPTAPTELSATASASTRIDVSWKDNSADELGFRIERCQQAGCQNFVEIAQVGANATSYSDPSVVANTTYAYRVRAHNAAGSSPYSNAAEATTPVDGPPPPAAPSGLTAIAISHTEITLAWTDNANNETGFTVERCLGTTCTNFSQVAQLGADVTSYANTGLQPSTTYRYRLRASNQTGSSAYSNTATASTPAAPSAVPSAPAGLTAQVVSASRIDLTWTDTSTNEDGFLLERCLGTGCTDFVQIAQTLPGVTTFSDLNLSANTTYVYRARAFNSQGQSGYSNSVEATTQQTPIAPPAAPANLTATAVSTTQINLTWNDVSTNEDTFRVERCTGSACTNYVEVAQVAANATGYADTAVVASTTYSYRVRAVNTGGQSPYSNTAEATTLSPPAPPVAPTGLVATFTSPTAVDLTWNDNATNEDGFHLERSLDSVTFTLLATLPANTTTYSDVGLNPDTDYYYRVRAFGSTGNSSYSNTAGVRTPANLPPPPAAPTGLTAAASSSTQINLVWTDAANNEDGFRIERCQGSGCTSFVQVAQTAAGVTSYSDSGLLASTAYSYRVRAFNAGGNSDYSNTAGASTPAPPPMVPAAPTNLIGTAGSATEITLDWTDSSANETGFRVERSIDGMTFVEIGTTAAGVTTYPDASLAPSTFYYYRVRAFNAVGNSAYSSVVKVRTKNR